MVEGDIRKTRTSRLLFMSYLATILIILLLAKGRSSGPTPVPFWLLSLFGHDQRTKIRSIKRSGELRQLFDHPDRTYCSEQLDLKAAQQAIVSNWIEAYKFYVS